jgi:hypothetical protein
VQQPEARGGETGPTSAPSPLVSPLSTLYWTRKKKGTCAHRWARRAQNALRSGRCACHVAKRVDEIGHKNDAKLPDSKEAQLRGSISGWRGHVSGRTSGASRGWLANSVNDGCRPASVSSDACLHLRTKGADQHNNQLHNRHDLQGGTPAVRVDDGLSATKSARLSACARQRAAALHAHLNQRADGETANPTARNSHAGCQPTTPTKPAPRC